VGYEAQKPGSAKIRFAPGNRRQLSAALQLPYPRELRGHVGFDLVGIGNSSWVFGMSQQSRDVGSSSG